MKYRKKSIEIEAVKWTGNNLIDVFNFLKIKDVNTSMEIVKMDNLIIKTLQGEQIASIGDYIIKGVMGEFYPCKPDIFEKTYEPLEEQ